MAINDLGYGSNDPNAPYGTNPALSGNSPSSGIMNSINSASTPSNNGTVNTPPLPVVNTGTGQAADPNGIMYAYGSRNGNGGYAPVLTNGSNRVSPPTAVQNTWSNPATTGTAPTAPNQTVTTPVNPYSPVSSNTSPSTITRASGSGSNYVAPSINGHALTNTDVANMENTMFAQNPNMHMSDVQKALSNQLGYNVIDPNFANYDATAMANSLGMKSAGYVNTPNGFVADPNYHPATDAGSMAEYGMTLNSNGVAVPSGSLNPATNNTSTTTSQSSPGINYMANGAAGYVAASTPAVTPWNVTGQQTVQGQMQSLIDPNSPYYQQWATQGAEAAAARGFTGNSSIRDSGILNAIMSNALPIAQQDATTYGKAAAYNADTPNQFALQSMNATNTANQFSAGQYNAAAANILNNQTSVGNTNTNAATSMYDTGVNANTSLANNQLNAQTSLANAATQAATSKYSTDVNAATSQYNTNTNAQTSLANAQLGAQSALTQANISANTQRSVAQINSDTQQTISKMNNTSQAAINAAHDANSVLINANQNTAAAWNNYINGIAQIQMQPGLDDNAKNAAVKNLTDAANAAGLNVTLADTAGAIGSGGSSTTGTPSSTGGQTGVNVSSQLTGWTG